MTKKDYVLIAKAFNECYAFGHPTLPVFLQILCVAFEEDNPRFSREKFMQAALKGEHHK